MIIVGITGPNAAGKSEVTQYLVERGFHHCSLSDVVREELQRLGLPPDRAAMTRTGARLRQTYGGGVLAERIRPRLVDRSVIDSIRHPDEISILRRAGDLLLMAVVAPLEVRVARTRRRDRPGDVQNLEAFLAEEAAQNSSDPAGQRIADCVALADVQLTNAGTVAQLRQAVDHALQHRFGTL